MSPKQDSREPVEPVPAPETQQVQLPLCQQRQTALLPGGAGPCLHPAPTLPRALRGEWERELQIPSFFHCRKRAALAEGMEKDVQRKLSHVTG